MTANADLEQLKTAIAEIGQRAANDPEYREQLRGSEVEQLQAAGVSALVLSGVLAEEGADEEEVSAYGMTLGSGPSGGDPTGIVINTLCKLGTCLTITVEITIGLRTSKCQS